ncbi:MAG: hypothetical protein LUE93_09145 [Bacteroides sp.]|nr:hypothetical protein [Bacteroides sp.]
MGTYIHTDSRRTYQEQQQDLVEKDFLSDITGKKYSLITEGIYEKNREAIN